MLPSYLSIARSDLGRGQPVKVRIGGDTASVAQAMADAMFHEIRQAQEQGRSATLIVPVGPVDQFPMLATLINEAAVSCSDTMFINMDEYLTERDDWLPEDHPLSFRGFMNRQFYNLLEPALAPRPENRVFPAPATPGAIQKLIQSRGGVDACFGGIGINGHIAFNEPPEPGEKLAIPDFAALPTRVVTLARETRTINSVTVGGEISVIPNRAVTIGMAEILASRRLRFFLQSPLAKRGCAASLARTNHSRLSGLFLANASGCLNHSCRFRSQSA